MGTHICRWLVLGAVIAVGGNALLPQPAAADSKSNRRPSGAAGVALQLGAIHSGRASGCIFKISRFYLLVASNSEIVDLEGESLAGYANGWADLQGVYEGVGPGRIFVRRMRNVKVRKTAFSSCGSAEKQLISLLDGAARNVRISDRLAHSISGRPEEMSAFLAEHSGWIVFHGSAAFRAPDWAAVSNKEFAESYLSRYKVRPGPGRFVEDARRRVNARQASDIVFWFPGDVYARLVYRAIQYTAFLEGRSAVDEAELEIDRAAVFGLTVVKMATKEYSAGEGGAVMGPKGAARQ